MEIARLRKQTTVFLVIIGLSFIAKIAAHAQDLGSNPGALSEQIGILTGILGLMAVAPMVYFLVAKKETAKAWTHVLGAGLLIATTVSYIQAEFMPTGNQLHAARIGPVPAYFLYLILVGLLWYLLYNMTKTEEAVATTTAPAAQEKKEEN